MLDLFYLRPLERTGSLLQEGDQPICELIRLVPPGIIVVDEIGGEEAARVWLAQTHGVPLTVPIEDLEIEGDDGLLSQFVSQVSRKTVLSKALTLDGLVSVWHPALR